MNGLITLQKRAKQMEIIEKIKTNKSDNNLTEIQKICLHKLQSSPLPNPYSDLWRLSNKSKLSNFLDKKGKYFGISSDDLDKSKRWFEKYGVSLVFWGRLVPGIRTLISVPAGIELMPLRKFLIWTSFGSLIWVALLTYAGYLFGENYSIIETYLDQIKYIVKPILILIFLYFFIRILIRFFKNRA